MCIRDSNNPASADNSPGYGHCGFCRAGYTVAYASNGAYDMYRSDCSTGTNCRSDICTDYAEDCCAPGDEPRGCSLAGYEVQDDWVGSSGWPSCVSTYGQESVYQCCSTSAGSGSFVYVDQAKSFDDARAYCRANYHDLASIHSSSENAAVAALCPGECWIGGSDAAREGTWTWSDGTAWDYENWEAESLTIGRATSPTR